MTLPVPERFARETTPEDLDIAVPLPSDGSARFLRARCGTGREFVLSVPREMRTALEANAWTYGMKAAEYQLEVRT